MPENELGDLADLGFEFFFCFPSEAITSLEVPVSMNDPSKGIADADLPVPLSELPTRNWKSFKRIAPWPYKSDIDNHIIAVLACAECDGFLQAVLSISPEDVVTVF